MITKRTKMQLLVFVIITVVGVSYVGARYAKLDRLFRDASFTVVAHFSESGGIYEGAEVNYRGVKVGEVGEMVLTDAGVDVHLEIDKEWDEIPADSLALVGNRSAVGEQYVELQPFTATGPYLTDDSTISETQTPIATEKLLTDASTTLASVDREALTTTIDELGKAFAGTGPDLQRILDTSSSFIETANDNFDVTRRLLRDTGTVLDGQLASEGSIRAFARDMSLFTGTLRGSTPDLLKLIENGSAGANELRTFIEENEVDLASLINRVTTTGELVQKYLPGIKQILVIYPYVVEGSYSVADRDPVTGLYNAHFGVVLTHSPVCHGGYEGTDRRSPYERDNRPMASGARCTEPASQATARGAQHAPQLRAGTGFDEPVVGTYDRDSGELTWGEPVGDADYSRPAPAALGEDSWKWLYLQPMMAGE